jgi:hypothetical protein
MALVSVGKLSPEAAPATHPKRHCNAVERERGDDLPSVSTHRSQAAASSETDSNSFTYTYSDFSVGRDLSSTSGSSSTFRRSPQFGLDQGDACSVQPFDPYVPMDLSGTFARLNRQQFDQATNSHSRYEATSRAPLQTDPPVNPNPPYSSSQDIFFNQIFETGNPTVSSNSVWPVGGSAPSAQPPSLPTYFPTRMCFRATFPPR